MEKLHSDIVDNILCRLPIETTLQAKQVCKTWKIILRSKTDKLGLLFAIKYSYSRYYREYRLYSRGYHEYRLYYGDPISGKMSHTRYALDKTSNGKSIPWDDYIHGMLGSCNGLVCFQRHHRTSGEPFLILNPVTREVVYVPKTNTQLVGRNFMEYRGPRVILSGFGYCPSTNEYKIVIMYNKEPRFLVYTVGGHGGWRSKESNRIHHVRHLPGVCANGALHWLQMYNCNNCRGYHYTVAAFDLVTENFKFIPLPHEKYVKYDHLVELLGGNNLYVVDTSRDNHCTDIWAYKRDKNNGCDMKENYNDKNKWHWIKEFRIEWEETYWKDLGLFHPMAITRKDELLLRCANKTIYSYDLKTSTMYKVFDCSNVKSYQTSTGNKFFDWSLANGYKMISVTPHANSIVPISMSSGT